MSCGTYDTQWYKRDETRREAHGPGKYTIAKTLHFCASHALDHLPQDHPCARTHGHNYTVEVILSGSLNQHGFVVDYRELAPLKHYIDQHLDHRHLNDVLPEGTPPTAENIAHHLFLWCCERWPQTTAVRVGETPGTWAEYREETP